MKTSAGLFTYLLRFYIASFLHGIAKSNQIKQVQTDQKTSVINPTLEEKNLTFKRMQRSPFRHEILFIFYSCQYPPLILRDKNQNSAFFPPLPIFKSWLSWKKTDVTESTTQIFKDPLHSGSSLSNCRQQERRLKIYFIFCSFCSRFERNLLGPNFRKNPTFWGI